MTLIHIQLEGLRKEQIVAIQKGCEWIIIKLCSNHFTEINHDVDIECFFCD